MAVKPGYKQTEVGVLPGEWEVSQVGHATTKVGSGITPTGGNRVYKSEGRPFLRSQNVGWGALLLDDVAFIDDAIHCTFADTEVKSGDVLLNITGASIGRSAIADSRVQGGNVNQHVCIVRPDYSRLNSQFLNCLFLSYLGQSQIDSFQAGGNRQGLNFGQVRSIRFPLPPLPEQREIAAALSDVDGLLGGLDRLIAKKRDLKHATMQKLLTGPTRHLGGAGGWHKKRLGDLIYLIRAGTYGEEKPREGLVGSPVATTAHIEMDDTWNKKEMTVRYFTPEKLRDYATKEGDLIVVKSSGSAASIQSGKLAFVDQEEVGKFVFSNFLMLLRPIEVFPRFLYYYLCSHNVKKLLPTLVEASTYPNIRLGDYLDIVIPMPPPEEQKAIASVLFDMASELFSLQQQRTKIRNLKQAMMQELLTGKTRLVKTNKAHA